MRLNEKAMEKQTNEKIRKKARKKTNVDKTKNKKWTN